MSELVRVQSNTQAKKIAQYCAENLCRPNSRKALVFAGAATSLIENLRNGGLVMVMACLRDEYTYSRPSFRLEPFGDRKFMPRVVRNIDHFASEVQNIVGVPRDYTKMGRESLDITDLRREYELNPRLTLLRLLIFEPPPL